MRASTSSTDGASGFSRIVFIGAGTCFRDRDELFFRRLSWDGVGAGVHDAGFFVKNKTLFGAFPLRLQGNRATTRERDTAELFEEELTLDDDDNLVADEMVERAVSGGRVNAAETPALSFRTFLPMLVWRRFFFCVCVCVFETENDSKSLTVEQAFLLVRVGLK